MVHESDTVVRTNNGCETTVTLHYTVVDGTSERSCIYTNLGFRETCYTCAKLVEVDSGRAFRVSEDELHPVRIGHKPCHAYDS
jgi:hypothetical protein